MGSTHMRGSVLAQTGLRFEHLVTVVTYTKVDTVFVSAELGQIDMQKLIDAITYEFYMKDMHVSNMIIRNQL